MPLKHHKSGQTIIEVVVALALIALFISGVVIIQLLSVKNLKYAQNKSTATRFAREQIERVRVVRDSAGIGKLTPCLANPCYINNLLTPVPLSLVTPTGTYRHKLVITEADPSECAGGAGITPTPGVPTSTPPPASITHEGTSTTTAVSCLSVASGTISGGSNLVYIVTIANRTGGINVNNITGLGLTWTLRKRQCSGRNTQNIEVWSGYGSPASGSITVDFSSTSAACVIAVSRYSGANSSFPIEDAQGSNTVGQNGSCTAGVDNASATLSLTTTLPNSVLLAGSNTRGQTISVADLDYTQRAVAVSGSSPATRLYVHDRTLPTSSTDTISHTLSSSVDWSMSGVVIRPASVAGVPTLTPQPTGTVYKAEAYISWGESGTITPAPEISLSSCITDWR